ncbi:MAG TPA: hypothetical protein PLT82_12355 [Candidatus Hydrogenedens sp.]|nr:hypothetical protein [Candidatus Hydrogenedens sp.]HOL20634.1 hypothetical protein [Candidatus Hydrogenedens sp.]HPP59912.1 hypothetical protein [Candidatus Hydrogenedens sp.]
MDTNKINTQVKLYFLFFIGVALIVVGILGAIWGKTTSKTDTTANKDFTAEPSNTLPIPVEETEQTDEKSVPTNLDNPDQLIEYYRSQMEQDPQDPNTPAYLSAMGNIYKSKKMDCASAIPYYEKVMIDYPQWEGIKSVYPELADCYEQLNDYKGKIWVHQEAMKIFPPDSQEYLYAKTVLGLE